MARLQILELPEGSGDDRPPFVLVVDEVTAEEAERVIGSKDAFDGMAKKAGARAVAVFHGMTVDIPANSSAPVSDDPERAGTTQLVYAHERTRLELCDALLLSRDTTWRQLVEAVAERRTAHERLSREYEAATSNPAEVRVYLGEKEIDVHEITRRIANDMKQALRNRG